MTKTFRFHRRNIPWAILLFAIAGVVISASAWLLWDLPNPDELPLRLNPPSVRITDRFGRILYEALPESGGRHTPVPLEEIPLALQQATVATEDRNFYRHPGVDLSGILRAVWINLRGGETLAGGSTITQQVARNLLLSESERYERSLRRKLRESLLAWLLSLRYSKGEVLALYLNQSNYGGLSYGVQAASLTYFGKPVGELDLAESALLAGLPQAPALYNPFSDFEAAKERQEVVLSLMEAAGYIDADQRALAQREPLVFAAEPYPIEAPHFVFKVLSLVESLFTTEDIFANGGLLVRTSLDLDQQRLAEKAIRLQLQALKDTRKQPLGYNVNNAALAALDPYTGDVLAMVGSPDYFDAANAGAINMALSPRQPGSALKPFVYAAALDPRRQGAWTAATMLLDVTTTFQTRQGEAYTPRNYDALEHGPVPVRQALASSLNIPAVMTLDEVGLEALFNVCGALGITTLKDPEQYDLSLALGGGEVRLLELTAAYAAFASGGYRVDPRLILEVSSPSGEQLYSAPPVSPQRVLDERVAWLISDILSDPDARALGFGYHSALVLDRPAAVKTGTTSNFHDNWTIGYTPQLVTGVWVGNTTYEPMRDITGLTGAGPIWHTFMRSALGSQAELEFERPAGLVQVEVCSTSGLLPGESCPYRRFEWFIQGTQPAQVDRLYRRVEIDTRTGRLADAATPPQARQSILALDLPPPAAFWAHSHGLTLLSDVQQGMQTGADGGGGSSSPVSLLSPPHNATYMVSVRFPASAQRIPVEAAAPGDARQVRLYVDGELLAQFDAPPYRAWWSLTPGEHQAWAQAQGSGGELLESEVVRFTVLE